MEDETSTLTATEVDVPCREDQKEGEWTKPRKKESCTSSSNSKKTTNVLLRPICISYNPRACKTQATR